LSPAGTESGIGNDPSVRGNGDRTVALIEQLIGREIDDQTGGAQCTVGTTGQKPARQQSDQDASDGGGEPGPGGAGRRCKYTIRNGRFDRTGANFELGKIAAFRDGDADGVFPAG
jgi:hypothetical protein